MAAWSSVTSSLELSSWRFPRSFSLTTARSTNSIMVLGGATLSTGASPHCAGERDGRFTRRKPGARRSFDQELVSEPLGHLALRHALMEAMSGPIGDSVPLTLRSCRYGADNPL